MRKNRKTLACGLLALAMILTGTGYAMWTDTLNVTTKATTGELDVTFVDLGLLAKYDSEITGKPGWSIVDGVTHGDAVGFAPEKYFKYNPDSYTNENDNGIAAPGTIDQYLAEATEYNNVTFGAALVEPTVIPKNVGNNGDYIKDKTLGSDKIEIEVNNMYPGYAQAFRTDIINLGTLAARLASIKIAATTVADQPYTDEMLGIAVLVQKEKMADDATADVFKLCTALSATLQPSDFFTIGGVDFLRLSALEKTGVADAINNAIESADLLATPSKNSMDLFLAIGMDRDEEGVYTTGISSKINDKNDDDKSENGSATITLDMIWGQFNEDIDVGSDNANLLENQNTVTE